MGIHSTGHGSGLFDVFTSLLIRLFSLFLCFRLVVFVYLQSCAGFCLRLCRDVDLPPRMPHYLVSPSENDDLGMMIVTS